MLPIGLQPIALSEPFSCFHYT